MKIKFAYNLQMQLEEAGLLPPAARYASVVITGECMWKMKRFGVKVSGKEDSNLINLKP
ncbi:MAG: hypothetical protein J7619_29445 [Dyadobacter sp.]|uniref:hypothetical protein n=1 Tax=Dyadobacter sp. TaxID=1914288 RepID=UPI001B29CD82|nr:hypothetical protein [Dyadobacter sp.]MBO9616847.1 hypothetical protein [Dyadobacter sp.]